MEMRRQAPARNVPVPVGQKASPDSTMSDADLKRMYDAEREAAIGNARFRAIKSLVGNLLLLVVAGILFAIHWRWLRTRDSIPATG